MKLPLHYVVNETMRPLAEKYFLSSVPSGFQTVEHKVKIHTSGNFLEDNFNKVVEERTRLIVDEIKRNPNDGLMLWCDTDIIFFKDCAKEIECLAEGNDILFQRENNWNNTANFGVQVIRRNARTMAFYKRLLQMQQSSGDENDQSAGNPLLSSHDGPTWKLLPLNYSSESNGGCKSDSVLYHANCTAGNSLMKKDAQLAVALVRKEQSFEGFKCKKKGVLTVEYFRGYETRNESTVRMIGRAIEKYDIPDFDWIYVHTGDEEVPLEYLGKKAFCYATKSDVYENVCPDYVFDHWCQTQMDDYEITREEISKAGDNPPETDMIGWRGNITTHPSRKIIVQLDDKINYDMEAIEWNRSNPNKLTSHNFISLVDQARKWRYFIDVEGVGWSTRLKFFLFSKRVVFLLDRTFKEWYFPFLKPWEHYVPVRGDLSDLVEKLNIVKNDINLENKIRINAYKYAQNHLTREAALIRWKQLLT